ncbi:MAG: hypothetical protein HOE90_23875 [Bacteriovoracaceae bacterium]|jgi:hypothetical protein|nr:hypothetical protein [Bacteriovoracaceae bacterium]
MRKHIRFNPGPETTAKLDFGPVDGEFNHQLSALVFSEAYKGAGILTYADDRIVKDAKLKIEVGVLSPLKAKVAWIESVSDEFVKVGIEFLE